MTIEYTGSISCPSVQAHWMTLSQKLHSIMLYCVIPNPGGAPIVSELSTLPPIEGFVSCRSLMHGSSWRK